jgi:prevent-host-death family protein
MKEISISEFKTKCHHIIEQVRRTGRPIRVTRFGKPLARIVSCEPLQRRPRRWLGSMAGVRSS